MATSKKRVSDGKLIKVIREIITSDENEGDIAKKYGLTPTQLSKLKRTKRYQKLYDRIIESEFLVS